jgi:hypothetical protein
MTDGTPGWFRDPSDPSVARWHDGDKWTEHTLVIADQTPGIEPAPPAIPAEGAAAAGGFVAGDPEFHIPRHGGGNGRLSGLPMWAKVGAPIALVLLVIIGFVVTSSGNDDTSKDKTATVDTSSADLDAAVAAARSAGLADDISDARAKSFIERICSAATHPSAVDQLGQDLGHLPAADTSEVRKNVAALGEGATTRCRSAIAGEPGLIDQLQDQAAIAFSTTTTSPTIAGGTDTGTDAGTATTATGSGTGTTVKGKTTTTVKGGAKTTTTKATTTTSTTPPQRGQNGFPCSPEGARGVTSSGKPLTCQKECVSGKLKWSGSKVTCSTTPTAPPGTTPASTTPTTPTTSGGTTGGTGGPTTGP